MIKLAIADAAQPILESILSQEDMSSAMVVYEFPKQTPVRVLREKYYSYYMSGLAPKRSSHLSKLQCNYRGDKKVRSLRVMFQRVMKYRRK